MPDGWTWANALFLVTGLAFFVWGTLIIVRRRVRSRGGELRGRAAVLTGVFLVGGALMYLGLAFRLVP